MNVKRLNKLADFLDELPEAKFYFGHWTSQIGKPMKKALAAGDHDCGTTACAVGWMPAVFPRLTKWEDGETYVPDVVMKKDNSIINLFAAMAVFDIDDKQAEWLFIPYSCNGLGALALPTQVAKHIRKFIANKGISR